MKKLMTAMLGLSLLLGTVSTTFAQHTETNKKVKKSKKKKSGGTDKRR